jgi:predicted SAM-dependent methyltransferase
VKLIQDKRVLEIGDPSGRLATSLETYKEWVIIEPNKNNHINFKQNIHFIEGFFDNNFSTNVSIDIIVHSHLFEHIYEPNLFLKKCYELLSDGGEMFFGIPNMQHIAMENLSCCLGVFFEHTIFINKTNVIGMLVNNGFEILEIIDCENHSTMYHAKKGSIPNIKSISIIPNYKDVFFESVNKIQTFIHSCQGYSENEIYLFGASYNTQFLLAFGLSKYKIVGILDNCKEKQGKYLYGYNLQIFDPIIVKDKNCVVVVKNGYYSKEIIEQLYVINPLLVIIT